MWDARSWALEWKPLALLAATGLGALWGTLGSWMVYRFALPAPSFDPSGLLLAAATLPAWLGFLFADLACHLGGGPLGLLCVVFPALCGAALGTLWAAAWLLDRHR